MTLSSPPLFFLAFLHGCWTFGVPGIILATFFIVYFYRLLSRLFLFFFLYSFHSFLLTALLLISWSTRNVWRSLYLSDTNHYLINELPKSSGFWSVMNEPINRSGPRDLLFTNSLAFLIRKVLYVSFQLASTMIFDDHPCLLVTLPLELALLILTLLLESHPIDLLALA